MEALSCHNMALILSCYSYSHVFSAFPFHKFESVQTIKLFSSLHLTVLF